jgi:vitamin B12 transporter
MAISVKNALKLLFKNRERSRYYLTGGLLHSDGLLANNGINQNNIFGKLTYDLPTKGHLTLSLDNSNSRRGVEEVPPPVDYHDNYDRKRLATILSFVYPLAERLNLELDGHYSYLKTETRQGAMTTPELSTNLLLKGTDWGTRGKLVWGNSRYNLTTGMEFEQNQINLFNAMSAPPTLMIDKNFNRYGIFTNGTLSLEKLTILPGIRYDRVDADHNELSYTLGATYRLTEKSVLRGYFARGYSRSQGFMDNSSPQKGWTAQLGAESGDIPLLWIKGTLFYNDTWNMVSLDGTGTTSAQIRQGVEIELRTVPLYGFDLTVGYTLTDLRDKESRNRIQGVPGDLLKLAITYDNPSWGLHGLLNGNYVWWNDSNPPRSARDRNILWNLHLTQKLHPAGELSPELFLSVHNLFDTSQYADQHYANAGRWLEGGVRCQF